MRKNQKLLRFTIIAVFCISLIGFVNFKNIETTGRTSTSVKVSINLNANAKAKPKIIFGDDINYPPYSYIDSKGKPAGFNIELAKSVGTAMGFDVEIRLDEWSKIRQALENGEIDAISGMFYSKDRENSYSFTVKHSIANGDIFTRKNIKLKGIEELRNKTVVVQRADVIAEYLGKLGLNIKLVEVSTVREALKLVENGTYDYAGVLKLPGLFSLKEFNIKGLKSQDLLLLPNDYCMAVKKGNDSLLLILNGGLQISKATGEYQKIYDKCLSVYEEKNMRSFIIENKWIPIMLLCTLLGLLIISVILNQIVNRKTKELQGMNKILETSQDELKSLNCEMEANMEELIAMEEELRDQYDNLVESERKLKKSEERSKAIIDALPDIVFILDGEGVFLDCQASSEEELLMPKESFIGKTLWEIVPNDIAAVAAERIKEALLTNKLQRFEYELYVNEVREIYEMRIVKSRENEVIGITRNISTDKFYRDRIEYLSYHDQLTGLYNRRFFEEELIRLDVHRNYPLCLIMGDVNGLKLINDSFGHKTGDQLLIKVAEVLKKACRSDEIISRIGGDEFVILIPEMEKNHVEILIDRINEISKAEKIGSIELSISFGWGVKHEESEDICEIFNGAEDNMYKKKLFESPSIRSKTIGAIINTLNEKNKQEEQHSKRVSDLCRRLALVLGFSDREVEEMKSVGLLHDIGKIAISEEILNSLGELTEEEYNEMKRHPEIGYRILNSVNDMNEIADYVLYHHERWDGKGYPKGLKGEEIPIQARIISIADAYDAMTSERSYRAANTEEYAMSELRKYSGMQFDPNLVESFIQDVLGHTGQ